MKEEVQEYIQSREEQKKLEREMIELEKVKESERRKAATKKLPQFRERVSCVDNPRITVYPKGSAVPGVQYMQVLPVSMSTINYCFPPQIYTSFKLGHILWFILANCMVNVEPTCTV